MAIPSGERWSGRPTTPELGRDLQGHLETADGRFVRRRGYRQQPLRGRQRDQRRDRNSSSPSTTPMARSPGATALAAPASTSLTGAVALDGHLYVVGPDHGRLRQYGRRADGDQHGSTAASSRPPAMAARCTMPSTRSRRTDTISMSPRTKSFAGGGNVAGDSDAILLTYDVSGAGPKIDTEHFTTSSDGNEADHRHRTRRSATPTLPARNPPRCTATTAQSAQGSTITPPSRFRQPAAINNDVLDSVVYDPGNPRSAPRQRHGHPHRLRRRAGAIPSISSSYQADNTPGPPHAAGHQRQGRHLSDGRQRQR